MIISLVGRDVRTRTVLCMARNTGMLFVEKRDFKLRRKMLLGFPGIVLGLFRDLRGECILIGGRILTRRR